MTMPKLVQPTLDKIDITGLTRDLPKFERHYPEEAASFWSKWVEDIDQLLTLPDTWEWPLQTLLDAEKTRPVPAALAIPESITALHDKESEPTSSVSKH